MRTVEFEIGQDVRITGNCGEGEKSEPFNIRHYHILGEGYSIQEKGGLDGYLYYNVADKKGFVQSVSPHHLEPLYTSDLGWI